MCAIAVGAVVLWPARAEAITCEDARGSCEVTVDGTTEMGSCRCADCSPAVGFGGGGVEPLPEPTQEYCLEILANECAGDPVTDPTDVCTPEALALCQSGLIDYYTMCGGPTNRDEELCIAVGCCREVDALGIEAMTELRDCVSDYDDCEKAHEACGPGDETGGGGGGDDGGGNGQGTDDTAGTGDADEGSGCGCSTGSESPGVAAILFSLMGLARRRSRVSART